MYALVVCGVCSYRGGKWHWLEVHAVHEVDFPVVSVVVSVTEMWMMPSSAWTPLVYSFVPFVLMAASEMLSV